MKRACTKPPDCCVIIEMESGKSKTVPPYSYCLFKLTLEIYSSKNFLLNGLG
jgi:hypothetical protein